MIEGELQETAPLLDSCKETGQQLLSLIGSQDQPEIEQNLLSLESEWQTVTGLFHQRHNNLIVAMEKAMDFHDLLKNLITWLLSAEQEVAQFPPISQISTLDQIREELDRLDRFRKQLEDRAVERELLNQTCADVCEGASTEQAFAARKPVQDLNRRWKSLENSLIDRQQKLERALLEMGQFEQAYDQLMHWMQKSEQTLDAIQPEGGDLKRTEIELAKLQVKRV